MSSHMDHEKVWKVIRLVGWAFIATGSVIFAYVFFNVFPEWRPTIKITEVTNIAVKMTPIAFGLILMIAVMQRMPNSSMRQVFGSVYLIFTWIGRYLLSYEVYVVIYSSVVGLTCLYFVYIKFQERKK